MKKHIFAVGALGLLLLTAPASLSFAEEYTDQVFVTNQIVMGDVRIDLIEFEVLNGIEQIFTNNQTVVPGDQISKIPRIVNQGEPCWVRASISYSGDLTVTDNLIRGFGKDLQKIGEYYYYTNVLKSKESVDLFQTLQIPETLTEQNSGNTINLTVRAEAIQATSFLPDFKSDAPWGSIPVEDCIHETNNVLDAASRPVEFLVEYQGTSRRLVAGPDDFFQNFQRIMPGAVYQDQVTIQNTTDHQIELHFSTAYEEQTPSQMELLEKLVLTITCENQVLYKGNLKADLLAEGISLGSFAPGSSETMTYQINVPESLTNSYAQRAAKVRWIYQVKETISPTVTVPPSAGNNSGSGSGSSSPVKTGDSSPIIPFTLAGLGGLFTSIILFIKKWRRTHEA